jgi:hypothetical protein
MIPAHLVMDFYHVQFAAPEGFSTCWSALAHTNPRVAGSLKQAYSFPSKPLLGLFA